MANINCVPAQSEPSDDMDICDAMQLTGCMIDLPTEVIWDIADETCSSKTIGCNGHDIVRRGAESRLISRATREQKFQSLAFREERGNLL
jgi:hypothetical protein